MSKFDIDNVPARLELYERWLLRSVSIDEIAEMLNAEDEAAFWQDFRKRYVASGNDAENMLRELDAEERRLYENAKRDRERRAREYQDGLKRKYPNAPTKKTQPTARTLPEPIIHGDRRGGSNSPRKHNPIVRALGALRRGLFGRNK